MLRNDEIQAALLAYIKARPSILAKVVANEMKEDQWQGTDFNYPGIRIRMISNMPIASKDCSQQKFEVSFMVFSELASSSEADQIAGIINNELHDKQFVSNSIAFGLWTTNLIPAIRSDIQTWRAEVLMLGLASG